MISSKKELINKYLDGELNKSKAQEVEKMISLDKDLQIYLESIMRLDGLLNTIFEIPKDESNTQHLTSSIPQKKIEFFKYFSAVNWIQPMAIAASVAAVMVINNFMFTVKGIDLTDIERQIVMIRYNALENKLSNESLSWNDETKKFSVIVTPVKTYKTDKGTFCREYKEVINKQGDITSRKGLACREKKNFWPNKGRVSDFYSQG
jgi:surface antigen